MATLMARVKDGNGTFSQQAVKFTEKGKPTQVKNATSYFVLYRENGKRKATSGTTLELALVDYRRFQAIKNGAPELVQDFVRNAPVPPAGTSEPTLEQALATYLDELKSKSPATIYSYRSALEEFINHCGRDNSILKTGRPCLLSYKSWLYQQDMSETTRHNRLLRAVMFLKHFGIEKPLKRTDWPVPNEKTPDAYTRDEIAAMLKAAETKDERLLVEFFVYSGARDGEVMHAEKNDVRIKSGAAILMIQAKPEYGWVTKSKQDRKVRLPLEFAKRLLAARESCAGDTLLFPNNQGHPNSHLLRIIKKIAERAGIKNATIHKFRRTFATLLSDNENLQTIQELLGHQDIETTKRYLEAKHVESEAHGKAIEATFGDLANGK